MRDTNPGKLGTNANVLYWQTARPAGELADELGISRSKFYALIEPVRTGLTCEACEGQLVFASRTDREAGRARCAECAATAEVDPEQVASIETAPSETETVVTAPESKDGTQPGDLLPRSLTRSLARPEHRELWVLAACGVVVGLLAAAWVRRR